MNDGQATPLRKAIERIRSAIEPVEATSAVPLSEAAGCTVATEILAPGDLPAGADSAMDGYAVRHADLAHSHTLPVSARIAAGDLPATLTAGSAARIFTGAAIPAGADTVVRQEDCIAADEQVRIGRIPDAGANIRPAGQDVRHGDRIVASGKRLDAIHVGLLAALGIGEVEVRQPLTVGLLSTGDELLPPGSPPTPGRRHDANAELLAALLAGWGMRARRLGIAPDDEQAIGKRLAEAAASCDFLLATGGASVGEEDHLRAAVSAHGAVDLWRVAIKPGKPLLFGHVRGTPLLGLPGNPGAALVTALLLGRPALFRRQGTADVDPERIPVRAGFEAREDSRTVYLRCSLVDGVAIPAATQSSGTLASASRATGLAELEPGRAVARGDTLGFLPFALLC